MGSNIRPRVVVNDMASGGARAHSGPAPDPNALRRERDKAEWRRLPAAGREGEPPAWPLSRPTARERTLWGREWRRPQAIVWGENGQEVEVAMFVRALAVAERTKAPVTSRTLVRQLMDSLGLTVPGLRMNRWVIDGAESTTTTNTPAVAGGQSIRDRLSLVVND